jgi:hypothetical protein
MRDGHSQSLYIPWRGELHQHRSGDLTCADGSDAGERADRGNDGGNPRPIAHQHAQAKADAPRHGVGDDLRDRWIAGGNPLALQRRGGAAVLS